MSGGRAVGMWGVNGLVLAAGMVLPGYTTLGVPVLLVGIAAPFLLWRMTNGRGSWMALVTLGVTMSVVLGVALATNAGCPPAGKRVQLAKNKPSVTCAEVRASYRSFMVLFAAVALIGIGAPLYRRRHPLPDSADADIVAG